MSIGQLLTIKRRHAITRAADAELASHLPELGLPCMSETARTAFRAILDHETPFGNGSLRDCLALAEARGFCAHPMDWIPAPNDWQYSPLYQPWVDWLSDNGVTEFHEGNRLTKDNWDRWKPKARLAAFKRLLRQDVKAAHDLAVALGSAAPASVRLGLLSSVGTTTLPPKSIPTQQSLLKHFLTDPSAKVRAAAEAAAKALGGLESGGPVTFDLLARERGVSSRDLAEQSDLTELGRDFLWLVVETGDVEIRSIIASRLLDLGQPPDPIALFAGLPRPLWKRGLRATFKSNYWHIVGEYLGPERGTLTAPQMGDWAPYKHWTKSVIAELKTGELPINETYDPLRALGLVVDKNTAREILHKAVALGMKDSHPRLTMLKFNLTL
ncbi:conserved hypothetical protein [Bradyrhizobium sp. ORS 375]|uniref:hypothetical protein n=1 Tax=Bradyrhizobium sp. (strain ORS 375) TaxID=566679 RepID=UPI0002408052|nr:hypothetical protein [Bradyrhizobium sp. ORS 375]CCD95466.1 conserved hypothetical protein [Bradyrhizobium sp. ORS 375]